MAARPGVSRVCWPPAWPRFPGNDCRTFPITWELISIGLLVLAILFAAYVYGRRREVSELKHLLRDLHDRTGVTPSDEQLDQLSQVIQRSQRSFKELIDSFDDVAFACSLDGTLRTVNRRVTQLLGVAYTDVVGHKIDEFLDEPLRGEVETGLPRFLEKRRWSGLVRVQVKNSTRALYFDCVLNAIVKSDEVVGISALARDVTEEREKERRFTELFETLQEGVYFSTPEGKLLDANPALIQMLGCSSRDELLSLDPSALNLDPGQGPVLGRSADDRGSERSRELTLRRKDGTTGVFLDTSRAVWDGAGKIIRYQGTLVDVTERRKMEKALRQQEEFQRYLLESFPDLILVVDLDGRYSFVSSRIRDLLGRTPAEMLGKKVDDAEQEQSAEFVALYHDVSTGAKKFGFCEFGARHRDGSWRTMRANASPLFDAEGKASGVIVSVRDITVERKLEQQIIQSERLAAMGQMIGGFAHELNNPLTSIMGVAELLQEGEQEETRRKHLVMLQQQARRAADIVQNLMYFSRPPAPGKRSDQPERTGAADPAPARVLAAQEQYYGGFSAGAVSAGGHRRFASADADFPQSHPERRAGHARGPRSRNAADPAGKEQQVGCGHLSGRRAWHRRRSSAQHLRSFLYHQAAGARHGSGAEHLQSDFAGARRRD